MISQTTVLASWAQGGTRDKISKLSNERLVRARQFKVDHDGHIRDAGLMGPDSCVWISPDPAASKKLVDLRREIRLWLCSCEVDVLLSVF